MNWLCVSETCIGVTSESTFAGANIRVLFYLPLANVQMGHLPHSYGEENSSKICGLMNVNALMVLESFCVSGSNPVYCATDVIKVACGNASMFTRWVGLHD